MDTPRTTVSCCRSGPYLASSIDVDGLDRGEVARGPDELGTAKEKNKKQKKNQPRSETANGRCPEREFRLKIVFFFGGSLQITIMMIEWCLLPILTTTTTTTTDQKRRAKITKKKERKKRKHVEMRRCPSEETPTECERMSSVLKTRRNYSIGAASGGGRRGERPKQKKTKKQNKKTFPAERNQQQVDGQVK